MTDTTGPGRPKGSFKWGERKISEGQVFTPTAHKWLRANKDLVETLARNSPTPLKDGDFKKSKQND